MSDSFQETVFEALTGAEEGPEGLQGEAARREPGNALRHVASLSMTKVADGLIDPKLVLSWLLNALGAPQVLIGLLVPIREAGALLPQIFLAPRVEASKRRKWFWVAGSAGQGLAAAGIVASALVLRGWALGLAVCALLAVLALSRAACSVSYKDILGKTVGKTRRGAVTGTAGSASAAGVLVFAGLLISGALEQTGAVIAAIALAACLWGLAAALFSTLFEEPSEPGGGGQAVEFSLLREDAALRRFIISRGLLVSTALAPPYMVLLANESGSAALGRLGALVLASAGASLISSYLWGRLADKSSKTVLLLAGVIAAAAMAAAVALHLAQMTGPVWVIPAVLFVLMLAYHGVRQGRSTYLVDMAPEDRRSAYAAVSNTAIGLLLIAAGAIGGLFAAIGASATLVAFAVMALAGGLIAARLPEAEEGL